MARGVDRYGQLFVSSGSALAQRRLFEYAAAGDLTPGIGHYFDTAVGAKRSPESYRRIATAMGRAPCELLFLSDVHAELDATRAAGLQAMLCVRPGNAEGSSRASRSSAASTTSSRGPRDQRDRDSRFCLTAVTSSFLKSTVWSGYVHSAMRSLFVERFLIARGSPHAARTASRVMPMQTSCRLSRRATARPKRVVSLCSDSTGWRVGSRRPLHELSGND